MKSKIQIGLTGARTMRKAAWKRAKGLRKIRGIYREDNGSGANLSCRRERERVSWLCSQAPLFTRWPKWTSRLKSKRPSQFQTTPQQMSRLMGRCVRQSKRPPTWRTWTFSLLSNFSRILQPCYLLETSLHIEQFLATCRTKRHQRQSHFWSADGSSETWRSSASGDWMRQMASGNRLRDMLEWLEWFTEGGGQKFKVIWKWSRTSSRNTSAWASTLQ